MGLVGWLKVQRSRDYNGLLQLINLFPLILVPQVRSIIF